ncbi:MAG TPA: phage tail protein, partial [Pseudomonas sp.]|nr:phage tail protein [Pseudomonas sp.]
APYFNMLQRELVAIIQGAGITPDKDNDGQLLDAIRRLRGGAASNFGQWHWSDSLAGNPGAGRVALDNANPSLAEALLITEASADALDFTQSLGLLRAGDTVTFQVRDGAGLSHRFRVTGQDTDHGTYRSIPVEYVSGSGGLPEADAVVSVLLTQAGASDASIPLFMPQWWPNRASIPAGYAPADGQELSRATFPEAWAGIQAGNVPTVADGTWLSTATERGKYTAGDGTTSFRLPDYNGKSTGALGAVFMRGDGALSAGVAGVIQPDELREHDHPVNTASGSNTTRASYLNTSGGTPGGHGATLVAGGSETRPLNVTGCWIVKLFGSVTNPGSADAAQLATDLAALVSRITALEARQLALGDGQQMRDVTATRASNVTYTNTSGQTIFVIVGSVTGINRYFNVNGARVQFTGGSGGAGQAVQVCFFPVPDGATYMIEGTFGHWLEVRA